MYQTVNTQRLGRVIGFYVLTAVYASLIIALGFLAFGTKTIDKKVNQFRDYAIKTYPDDLVLDFNKDGLSVNKTEPFSIPIGETFNENQIKNLVTFRTTLETSTKDLEKADSFIVATKNKAYLIKSAEKGMQYSGYNIFSYDDVGIISVDKTFYTQKVEKLTKLLIHIMPLVIFLAVFFALMIFFVLNMFACLLFAFVVILISILKGWQFNYEEGYKLALIGTVPALFLGLILSILGLNFPMKNLVILIIFIVIIIPKKSDVRVDYSLADEQSIS